MKKGVEIWSNSSGDVVFEVEVDGETPARRFGNAVARAIANGIDLSDTNLAGVDLAGKSFVEIDFSECNLSGAQLKAASFRECNFSQANLSGANLENADLRRVYGTYANFAEGNLQGANLTDAEMIRVNMSGANLRNANLTNCQLYESDLTEAILDGIKVLRTNIADTLFLDTSIDSVPLFADWMPARNMLRRPMPIQGMGPLAKLPIQIDLRCSDFKEIITILDTHIAIGSVTKSFEEWSSISSEALLALDVEGIEEFWKRNQEWILGLAREQRGSEG